MYLKKLPLIKTAVNRCPWNQKPPGREGVWFSKCISNYSSKVQIEFIVTEESWCLSVQWTLNHQDCCESMSVESEAAGKRRALSLPSLPSRSRSSRKLQIQFEEIQIQSRRLQIQLEEIQIQFWMDTNKIPEAANTIYT